MKNLLLRHLSETDFRILEPHLKTVAFEQHSLLFEADQEIRSVYFPAGAVVSLVVTLSTGEMIETAMVGIDGVVGAAAALDGRMSLCRGIVQLGGDIVVCNMDALKTATLQSPRLLALLMRHEQAVYAQAQQSAACFASHSVQARLCRWLLRARDLSGSDQLQFTQEYLGQMLGARRSSVTVVARTLQAAGLIRYARGKIRILDAEGLEEGTCECYAAVKARYEQLLGTDTARKIDATLA
ncbi:Crp/Fnr family transcriptional regulator [Bradyrhizobium japonicum]|uniref:Crp/Fnr family transcriptional regulator n=1 Tax=Bradyrhizobium japonicum TaxID=375 RepID=UPI001B8A3DEF|nr:Crp/Fnr family transcriptional regulator [Bradyrhizobium japonicum]MBR0972996.1 Crp/Fnr family transcriptional regulator [Bradyrhizobium japonicum]